MNKLGLKLRISETLFFTAGASMLLLLPFLDQETFWIWAIPKSFYLTGLVLYLVTLKK